MGKTSMRGWMVGAGLVAGLPVIVTAGPDTAGQPALPFEFGPDWRWVPPGQLFPSPGGETRGPSLGAPMRQPQRPEPPPSEAAQRAEALKRAMAPRPDPAISRRRHLDDLLARLEAEQDPDSARPIAEQIEQVWLQSGSTTADLLMQRALAATNGKQHRIALGLLDKITALEPGWVEGWNRRAAARLQSGDVDGAMADVNHALELEPRHFGAMLTMGAILEQTGFENRALDVLKRALAIYPSQPRLRDHIDRLSVTVDGQGI